MRFKLITFLTILISFYNADIYADEQFNIKNFILINDLENTNGVSIAVADSLNRPLYNFNGTYNFSINGFNQTLMFKDGIAESNINIEKSIFLYVKHENIEDSVSKLYYIFKKSSGINPISISWYILIAIPAGLILIGYMFRKLIGIVIFCMGVYLYFNHSKGLSIGTFMDSIFDGLKGFF